MEEKKNKSAKASNKMKTTAEATTETVDEVKVESTEATEVETKDVSQDAGNKPAKGKRASRRGGNNKALELELEKQKELLAEADDKYKRLLAEFENARNRNEKESKRMYDIGAKEVLEQLLPVVDNFERALQTIPEEDKERAFEQGVDKIYKQLMVALDEIGVKSMDATGTEFNPDFHNAVMHVEDEAYGENMVVEELQKGYLYKEDVLRYSMVKVAN